VVARWPLVPKYPTEAVGFLRAKRILSMPSFGGEVKPSIPCRRFAACKRFLNGVEVVISATVPPLTVRISRVVADVEAPGGKTGNV